MLLIKPNMTLNIILKLILNSKIYSFRKKIQIICMGYFTTIYKNIYLINYNKKRKKKMKKMNFYKSYINFC